MESSAAKLIGLAALAVAAAAAFAIYRWRQRRRVRWVEGWVQAFLSTRYGRLPDQLYVNCSDDRSWPVLVTFRSPTTSARHRLQFACPGGLSTFLLLSEKEDTLQAASL